MRYLALCALVFMAVAQRTLADPPGGDWPQWMGPNRSNHSAETGLLNEWPKDGPPVLWKVSGLGQGVASVAISGGRIYTLGYLNDHEHLIALSEGDGKQLWTSRIGPAIPEAGPMRYLAQRTPTVDGERVYAVTARGVLVCLATTNGEERWRKDLVEEFGARRGPWGFCDYPLVDGDQLICTPAGPKVTMAALDKTNGRVIWTATGGPNAEANAYSAVIVAEYGGVRQYINFVQSGLISFAATDGKFLWHYGGHATRSGNTHNLVPMKDELFSANGFRTACVLLRPIKSEQGFHVEPVYREAVNFQWWFGTAVRVGDHVITLANRGTPQCHELATGKLVWKYGEGSRLTHAAMTMAEGRLILRYAQGKVILFEASPQGGRVVSEFEGPVTDKEFAWTLPVVTAGRLYIRDHDRLFCYDVKEPRRKTKAPDAVFVATPQDVVEKMLDLAKVKKSDLVYDLGCGDGRIVVTAARLYGCPAVGIDIDPVCVQQSLENVRRHKVEHLVRIEQSDLFKTDLSKADVVTLYLLPNMNEKLLPQLEKLKPGSRVVAHHFPIPGVKPDKEVQVESNEDGEKHTVYLWTAPLKKTAP